MRAHLLQYPVRDDAALERCLHHGYRARPPAPDIRSVAKTDTPDSPAVPETLDATASATPTSDHAEATP
jgi:hypothetical protein